MNWKEYASFKLRDMLRRFGFDDIETGWRYLKRDEQQLHDIVDGCVIEGTFRCKGRLKHASFVLEGSPDKKFIDRILEDVESSIRRRCEL